jgi:hypothetical protein
LSADGPQAILKRVPRAANWREILAPEVSMAEILQTV